MLMNSSWRLEHCHQRPVSAKETPLEIDFYFTFSHATTGGIEMKTIKMTKRKGQSGRFRLIWALTSDTELPWPALDGVERQVSGDVGSTAAAGHALVGWCGPELHSLLVGRRQCLEAVLLATRRPLETTCPSSVSSSHTLVHATIASAANCRVF